LVIALGTGLLTFGLGAFSLPFGGGRRGRAPTKLSAPARPLGESAPIYPATAQTPLGAAKEDPKAIATYSNSSSFAFFIVVGLALLAALLLALQVGGHKKG
jgi:hypothetical protein